MKPYALFLLMVCGLACSDEDPQKTPVDQNNQEPPVDHARLLNTSICKFVNPWQRENESYWAYVLIGTPEDNQDEYSRRCAYAVLKPEPVDPTLAGKYPGLEVSQGFEFVQAVLDLHGHCEEAIEGILLGGGRMPDQLSLDAERVSGTFLLTPSGDDYALQEANLRFELPDEQLHTFGTPVEAFGASVVRLALEATAIPDCPEPPEGDTGE